MSFRVSARNLMSASSSRLRRPRFSDVLSRDSRQRRPFRVASPPTSMLFSSRRETAPATAVGRRFIRSKRRRVRNQMRRRRFAIYTVNPHYLDTTVHESLLSFSLVLFLYVCVSLSSLCQDFTLFSVESFPQFAYVRRLP